MTIYMIEERSPGEEEDSQEEDHLTHFKEISDPDFQHPKVTFLWILALNVKHNTLSFFNNIILHSYQLECLGDRKGHDGH